MRIYPGKQAREETLIPCRIVDLTHRYYHVLGHLFRWFVSSCASPIGLILVNYTGQLVRDLSYLL